MLLLQPQQFNGVGRGWNQLSKCNESLGKKGKKGTKKKGRKEPRFRKKEKAMKKTFNLSERRCYHLKQKP